MCRTRGGDYTSKGKAETSWRFWVSESRGLRLEAVEQAEAECMRTLSTESRTSRIGRITLDAKQTGERKAGNPPIAFDVAGTGNVAWSRCCDTSQPKGRGNREHKLRPKPARQSPTLPVRGGGGNILTYSAPNVSRLIAEETSDEA